MEKSQCTSLRLSNSQETSIITQVNVHAGCNQLCFRQISLSPSAWKITAGLMAIYWEAASHASDFQAVSDFSLILWTLLFIKCLFLYTSRVYRSVLGPNIYFGWMTKRAEIISQNGESPPQRLYSHTVGFKREDANVAKWDFLLDDQNADVFVSIIQPPHLWIV